jgi:hypothetical protein
LYIGLPLRYPVGVPKPPFGSSCTHYFGVFPALAGDAFALQVAFLYFQPSSHSGETKRRLQLTQCRPAPCYLNAFSTAQKQIDDQSKEDTQKQTGDQGKIKSEIPFLVIDIPRQPTKRSYFTQQQKESPSYQ